MFKSILVPTDGSDLAAKAVEQAIVLANEIGAKITAMTVTEPFPPHLGSVGSSELEYAPIEYMKARRSLRRVGARYGIGCGQLRDLLVSKCGRAAAGRLSSIALVSDQERQRNGALICDQIALPGLGSIDDCLMDMSVFDMKHP